MELVSVAETGAAGGVVGVFVTLLWLLMLGELEPYGMSLRLLTAVC